MSVRKIISKVSESKWRLHVPSPEGGDVERYWPLCYREKALSVSDLQNWSWDEWEDWFRRAVAGEPVSDYSDLAMRLKFNLAHRIYRENKKETERKIEKSEKLGEVYYTTKMEIGRKETVWYLITRKGKEKREKFGEVMKPAILKVLQTLKDGGLLSVLHYLESVVGSRFYYLYKDALYTFDRGDYSPEQMVLQILDFEDKERRKFEHLKAKFELAQQVEKIPRRETIPEEARIAVWRRDEGKCARCGSRKNLEYDHIIPLSKGGSNTVRNIELLCEECNRRKKDNIA